MATDKGEEPISQVKVGDHVLAYNEQSASTGYYTVTVLHVNLDPALVYLTIAGEPIETTPEHPFYVEGKGWVNAGELHEGDRIRKADGSTGAVEAVRVEQRRQVMYNLTVDIAHTYFVGWQQWLVHNIEPCEELRQRAIFLNSLHGSPTAEGFKTISIVIAARPKVPFLQFAIVASNDEKLIRRQVNALVKGEEIAAETTLKEHAEITALKKAEELGYIPLVVVASRPICDACLKAIEDAGAFPGSPLKNPRKNVGPFGY